MLTQHPPRSREPLRPGKSHSAATDRSDLAPGGEPRDGSREVTVREHANSADSGTEPDRAHDTRHRGGDSPHAGK
jgi:hypothetical protein